MALRIENLQKSYGDLQVLADLDVTIEQGEFVSREEAIEQLLSSGIRAYKTSGPADELCDLHLDLVRDVDFDGGHRTERGFDASIDKLDGGQSSVNPN